MYERFVNYMNNPWNPLTDKGFFSILKSIIQSKVKCFSRQFPPVWEEERCESGCIFPFKAGAAERRLLWKNAERQFADIISLLGYAAKAAGWDIRQAVRIAENTFPVGEHGM